MLALFRKILILALTVPFTILNSFAQKNEETRLRNAFLSLQDSASAAEFSENDVSEYFINVASKATHLRYLSDKGITSIHIDSLPSLIKLFVDYFIERYNSRQSSGSDYIKDGPNRTLYNSLISSANTKPQLTSNQLLNQSLLSIKRLPDSKEKIILLLEYYRLNIQAETYYNDARRFCDSLRRYADKISNLYEKSLAFEEIGDFAHEYTINDISIQMYYLAKEFVQNSNADKKTKYNRLGVISQSISLIFYQPSSEEPLEKELFYLTDALNNYSKAENYYDNIYIFFSIVGKLSFERRKSFLEDGDFKSNNFYNKLLSCLREWYSLFSKDTTGEYTVASEGMYFAMYGISQNVINKSKDAGLFFYLYSLLYSTSGSYLPRLMQSLVNVSTTYAELGKENLALAYADLEVYAANQLNNLNNIGNALINKGRVFLKLKNYDSALFYENKVLFDATYKYTLSSGYYSFLMASASHLKSEILDSLKLGNDSSRIYERRYMQFNLQVMQYHLNDVETEATSIKELLERAKNKEIDISNELAAVSGKGAAQAKLDKGISDSLRGISDSLRRREKVVNASILSKTKKLDEEENDKLIAWAIAILLFVSLLFTTRLIRVQKKRRKAEKKALEKEFDKKLAEQELLNDTALGHDLITQMDHLVMFSKSIKDDQHNRPELDIKLNYNHSFVTEVSAYFNENYLLKGDLQNTLSKEILLAKRHCAILNKMIGREKEVNIYTTSSFDLIADIEIPKHTFVNFIGNSFKHGGIGKDKINIQVDASEENGNITIVIEDDGIGFKSMNLEEKRPNRGINLVIKQIENYNSIESNSYTINFSPKDIQNKNEGGVKVIYKLIKK